MAGELAEMVSDLSETGKVGETSEMGGWKCQGVANAKASVVDLGMSESVAESVSESTSVCVSP